MSVETECAPQAKDLEANMPRLLSKVHTGNVSVLERFPLDKLPPNLTLIGTILCQFDQTIFNILAFTTNFALLSRLYQLPGATISDFKMFYPCGSQDADGFETVQMSELGAAYDMLKAAFGEATDLSLEEFEQIMIFDSNRIQLHLFCQAFAAVWLRDYGETVEVTPSGLIEHLRILFAFEEMSEEEKAGIDPEALKNSVRCVRHVLVTFTHMASKDYERITRSG